MRTKIFLLAGIVILALAACASPSTVAPTVSVPSSSSTAAEIQISGFAFNPTTITVKIGTEVKWTNMDNVSHTVTSDTGTELDSPALSNGASYSHIFNTEGTYTYHCAIHPSMTGTVIVTK
jgi:plastocyanin